MTTKAKVSLLAIIFLISLIFCVILIIYFINYQGVNKNPTEFINKISQNVQDSTGKRVISDAVKRNLDSLTSNKSDKEKYLALKNLSFYYSDEYSKSRDPKLREFSSQAIDNYAKSAFPKFYDKNDFIIPCADPSCGEKMNTESETILKMINSSGLEDYRKETIVINYKTASYIPIDRLAEKRMGMTLVVNQLTRYGDPVASQAAQSLKEYLIKRYKMNL